MSRQRRRDTEPELALRRELHARGLRYRLAYPVPGVSRCTIDIAWPSRKIAVFVDGCFWHRCPLHASMPHANGSWWAKKLEGNVARDQKVNAALEERGWTVVRVWEHEDPAEAAERIAALVQMRPARRQ